MSGKGKRNYPDGWDDRERRLALETGFAIGLFLAIVGFMVAAALSGLR